MTTSATATSEILGLPAGWRIVPLRDLCTQDRDIVAPGSARQSTLPYLSLEHVQSGTGRILHRPEAPIEDAGRSATFAFDGKHVLYGKLRPYLNKVAVPDRPGRCTTEIIPLAPREGVDRQYLAWLLRRGETVRAAMAEKTGSRMPRASMDNLFGMTVPLPPPDEQRRIAAILDEQMAAIERARTAAEQQLGAARALPASYLRAVFGSDEAQAWPVRKLATVCRRITDGTHQPPVFTHEGVPFLFVRNIVGGRIDFGQTNFVSEDTYRELTKNWKPERGDVLYSAVGSFGVAVPVETDREFTFQRHIAHIKPDAASVHPTFLCAYLNSPAGKAQSLAAALGNAQKTVTLGSLGRFDVPVPALDTQDEVVRGYEEIQSRAESLTQTLGAAAGATANLPAAVLRAAFNGEL